MSTSTNGWVIPMLLLSVAVALIAAAHPTALRSAMELSAGSLLTAAELKLAAAGALTGN